MTKSKRKSLARQARIALPALTAGAAAVLMLSMVSAPAMAENNVSIYGIIDVGLLYQGKTDPSGSSKTSMETSGLRQTIIGFKGDRDFGNGLKGFFNLEAHFDTNNGMFHGTGDAVNADGSHNQPFFRRQANVGLSGDWGSVTLGRQYGPALLAHLGTEPRAFKEQFSNLYAWAYNQYAATAGAPGQDRNTNNDVGIFFNNAVQYRNTVGPVTFGVLYAIGGQAGNTSDNSAWALGASYTGPVTLSASYQVIKDQATGNDNVKHWGLGFAVPVGPVALKLSYLNFKNEAVVAKADVDAIGAGVDWKWSPKNTMTVAYYDNEDKQNKNDRTHDLVVSNDFALRSDTTLYVQAAYVDAGSAATIRTSIVAAGVPAVGEKTFLINAGINYTF